MKKSSQNGTVPNGTKYTLASQKEKPAFHEYKLDKSERSCCEKCALSGCILGIIFIIGGIASAFIIKPFVNNKIIDNLVLMDGEAAFLGWKDPPVNPVMKVFFFNLTNEEAFLQGKEKPKVNKVGPYVYVQNIHKVNVAFDETGDTVTFSDNKTYFFSSSLTNGSESDLIIMPNIPLFGAFRRMENDEPEVKSVFEWLLNSYDYGIDKTPFIRLTVKEFLWGYPSIIMSMNYVANCNDRPNDEYYKDEDDWGDMGWGDDDVNDCRFTPDTQKEFGFYMGFNQTVRNERTVKTGKGDISAKGLMTSFEGLATLGTWPDEQCNVIDGREPGTLTIGLTKKEQLNLYFSNMCRNIQFQYRKTVEQSGFKAYRFSPVEETFHSPQHHPDNSCFCDSRVCLPSGVFDIGVGCKPGSPVYMSWPHFLHGDPILRKGVDGLQAPDRDEDEFYLDIEPDWGTTLTAHAAFQFNVLVRKNGFSWLNNVEKRVMLPFMMLEEGVAGPSEIIKEKIKLLMTIGENVKNISFLIAVCVGFLCMVPEIVLWLKSCCHDK